MLVPAMMDALSFPLTLAMAVRKLKIDRAIVREGGRATVIIGGASRSASTTAEHRIIECSAAIPSPPPTAAAMFACSFASEKGLVSRFRHSLVGVQPVRRADTRRVGVLGRAGVPTAGDHLSPVLRWPRGNPSACRATQQTDPCEVAMTSVMFFFRLLHTAAPCGNKDAPKVAGLTVSVAAVSWWHSTVATPGRVPFTDKMRAG